MFNAHLQMENRGDASDEYLEWFTTSPDGEQYPPTTGDNQARMEDLQRLQMEGLIASGSKEILSTISGIQAQEVLHPMAVAPGSRIQSRPQLQSAPGPSTAFLLEEVQTHKIIRQTPSIEGSKQNLPMVSGTSLLPPQQLVEPATTGTKRYTAGENSAEQKRAKKRATDSLYRRGIKENQQHMVSTMEKLVAEVENLKRKIQDKETLVAETGQLKSNLVKLEAENEKLKSEIANLNSNVGKLEAEIQEKKEEIETLRTDNEQLKLKNGEMERELMQCKLELFKAENERLKYENEQLKCQNERLNYKLTMANPVSQTQPSFNNPGSVTKYDVWLGHAGWYTNKVKKIWTCLLNLEQNSSLSSNSSPNMQHFRTILPEMDVTRRLAVPTEALPTLQSHFEPPRDGGDLNVLIKNSNGWVCETTVFLRNKSLQGNDQGYSVGLWEQEDPKKTTIMQKLNNDADDRRKDMMDIMKALSKRDRQCFNLAHDNDMLFTAVGITKSMKGPSMNSKTGTFTSSEIIEITSNFKTRIETGGFGEVYLGTLKDGTDVAVMVLLSSSEQCRKAFLTEAKLLTEVRQGNLVSLVGYCDDDGKEALILDYMPNGNLKQHLSEKSERVLRWIQRLHFVLTLASGLKCLHSPKSQIVHRDLKPDNILFNEYMQAKIADFGLSKAFATESASHISTCLGGTPGYIDHESFNTGHIFKKSDVFSFGIILQQLVTGKPAIITRDKEDRINIISWIDPLIKKGDIQNIVDPRLNGEFDINAGRKAIKRAISCLKSIKERPDISHVLTKLKECMNIEMDSKVLDETSRTNVLVRLYRNTRQKGTTMKSMEERPMNLRNTKIFTCTQLVKITSNFLEVIGEGAFGRVYFGTLNVDAHVAVRVFSPSSMLGYKEFQTEVELLSHLSHKNVVSLVGYCDENGMKALIYEYMANGNLREHLSGKCKRILSWNERLQIAIDIASGLEYLQMCCGSFIVHRNLNPRSILLTKNMRGKIRNFGLGTSLYEEFQQVNYVHVTHGYMAPEYLCSGEINKKTDLYSFGIILLELLTGQPPFALDDHHWTSITDHIRPTMETGDIQRIVDPKLQGKFNINTAWKVAKLAMSCASAAANKRPDISHVLVELKECLELEMPSQQTNRIQIDMKESQTSECLALEMPSQHTQGIQIDVKESQNSDESYLSPP